MLLLAASALTAAHGVQAAPVGGQVTSGAGVIQQSGPATTVTQSSSALSLAWQSFDTAAGDSVTFVQPSASAVAVNRILGADPTQFLGRLNANGQVYLINPNGVMFGTTSSINVGGLVASTLDIPDAELAGASRRFAGSGTGEIVNRGAITTADGGYVAFIGARVNNAGTITAPSGAVALGAGSDVTLSFAANSLVKLQVNQSALSALAENGGLIQADGGAVLLSAGARDAVVASVVNNSGVVQARSVRDVNGVIVLEGGQQSTVTNAGLLDASGRTAGETGGAVKVLGESVELAVGGKIDVAGDRGGGTTLVGGNFLGAGPEANAKSTTVAAGSTIDADAISAGDGGRVAVWSDGATSFNGSIQARGGQTGGEGGSVETSGALLKIGSQASVSTAAPHGGVGSWLLDPQDITIGGFGLAGDIDYQQLSTALQSSNVTIKTGPSVTCTGITCSAGSSGQGDIVLLDGISIGTGIWTSGTTLTLSAYRHVAFQGTASIDASSGNGNVVLRADNSATGTGRVDLGQHGTVYGNATGKVDFYYNPTSYASPTLYENLIDPDFGNNLVYAPNFNAYMLVNVMANIANKTYDGTTAATYSGLSLLGAAPAGVTVDFSSATAAFSDRNAGANKAVTIGGVGLSGANASKYALNGLSSKTASITKANLSLTGISANNKTYNGTTAATISGSATLSASIGGDVVSVSGTGAGSTFATKNVGTGKAVTVAGYTLTGAEAGNYNLVLPINLTADVTKANLAVSGVSANTKTYDGTNAATLSGTATVSAIGSDVVSVSGTASGAFVDKNAGSNKAVAVTGYGLSGADAGNYNVVQPTGLTATINKANLTVSGVSAADKTYDGSTAATLSGTAAVSAFGADVVSVAGTGSGVFANKNAGANKAVTVTGYSLSGADAGNYNVVQPTGLTATVSKADLSLSGVTANNKTYDGTTAATISGSASVSAFGADVVSVSGAGAGSAFADKNAGTGKAVTLSGYTLSGLDAANYNLALPTNLTANIAKANLNVSGVAASNKTYDGTTASALNGTATVSAFGSDVVSVTGTGSGAFADKNVGSGKAVTVTGYSLTGADAGNYNAVQPASLTANISKANLAVSGLSVANKTYDGTTAATLSGSVAVTAFGGDVVSVSGTGSGAFADKNAGTGKAVTVTGYGLSGTDAGNYNIVQPAGLTANIGKADLAVSGLSAADKTYDGTTAATLSGTASVTAIGGDVVSITGTGTGSFADKNAGANKAVTVTGYSLSGVDASNYSVVQPANLTANIAKADLTLSGVAAAGKTYDGTTAATLTGAAGVAAYGADVVSVSGSGAGSTFASKNVGIGKAVTVEGYALTGADAGNYNLALPTNLTADIAKASLAVSGVSAVNRTYDGTTAAVLNGTASVSAFGSDVVSVSGAGAGSFADKTVGANKAVAVTGYSLSGSDAGNYDIVQPTGLTAAIGKANLTLAGLSAVNRTYDSTTAASLTGTATVSAIGGDVVSVTGAPTAAFATKDVGTGKAVTVTGYGLTGADAGNYSLVLPGLTANITPATLTVSGIRAADKLFDGSVAAVIDTRDAVLAGRFGSDVITLASTGAFSDATVGAGKTVQLTNAFGGADLGNYRIVDQPTASASILAAPVVTPPPAPPTPAAPPVIPTPSGAAPADPRIANVVAQIQSSVLPPQAAAQGQPRDLGSADPGRAPADTRRDPGSDPDRRLGTVNTLIGRGPTAPVLQIQNGGLRLPPLAAADTE